MRKKLFMAVAVMVLIGLISGFLVYKRIYGSNVNETSYLYIPTGTDFKGILALLEPYVNDLESFEWVAEKKNYPNRIRPGKYRITKGMSNAALVDYLRGGEPETVRLTFNNQDSLEKLAGRVAVQIEADSVSLLQAMRDEAFLKRNDFSGSTALAMYLPNSYEFYWNTSAESFRDRMLTEYKRYWSSERLDQAEKQNLTPLEVITLASIVQKETAVVSERKRVAGLYLNRLRDFWPLQADPTIIFALKQEYGEDKEYKRVLNKDLTIDSPYNTYMNFGLPPGPIGMPDISSIEAVLAPEQHRYYYMCASVEQLGHHKFARTLQEHQVNARAYQKWVSEQGIDR